MGSATTTGTCVFPGSGTWIFPRVASGELRATEEVYVELKRQDDELIQWIDDYREDLFVEVDEQIQREALAILSDFPTLIHAGRGRSGTDPFVIRLAKSTQPLS
jgi:hypothetical protein